MTIPNLSRASAVQIGGRWTLIQSAKVSDLEGWVSLQLPGFTKISVRAKSIEAVRYQDLPVLPPKPVINTPWGDD